jgi:hypothetical protein
VGFFLWLNFAAQFSELKVWLSVWLVYFPYLVLRINSLISDMIFSVKPSFINGCSKVDDKE